MTQANNKVTFTKNGKTFSFVAPKDDHLVNVMKKTNDFYEGKMLDYIAQMRRPGIYLDIGANIGTHCIFFATQTPATGVIAYEPTTESLDYLAKNIKANKLEELITVVDAGLGAKAGNASIKNKMDANLGGTSIRPDEKGGLRILTIDAEHKGDDIAVMNIDVEGFEPEVLKGAKETLKRCHPDLFIEAHDQTAKDNIEAIIAPLGYKPIKQFNATPTYHYKWLPWYKRPFTASV